MMINDKEMHSKKEKDFMHTTGNNTEEHKRQMDSAMRETLKHKEKTFKEGK